MKKTITILLPLSMILFTNNAFAYTQVGVFDPRYPDGGVCRIEVVTKHAKTCKYKLKGEALNPFTGEYRTIATDGMTITSYNYNYENKTVTAGSNGYSLWLKGSDSDPENHNVSGTVNYCENIGGNYSTAYNFAQFHPAVVNQYGQVITNSWTEFKRVTFQATPYLAEPRKNMSSTVSKVNNLGCGVF